MTHAAPRPQPSHLGPAYGVQFRDESMARAYPHRPPYAAETLDVLVGLVPEGAAGRVLDAGCGTGDLARRLAPRVHAVDALDPSEAMIKAGQASDGGDHPALRWIESPMEVAPLDGRYDLIVAGESVHWMDWDVVFARFAALLAPGAFLAVVERCEAPPPWRDELRMLVQAHSTNQEFEPYDIFEELASRRLFLVEGRHATKPVPFAQRTDDHVESMHSRNGFSRERMGTDAALFDDAYRSLLDRHGAGGEVRFATWDTIVWGRPNPT